MTGLPGTVTFKCKDGLIFAANPITRYGSTLKGTNVERFAQYGQNMVFLASGDGSDFQKLNELMNKKWYEDSVYGDLTEPDVEKYAHYLKNECYRKRGKIDPYLIDASLGGFDLDGNARLFYVDQFGTMFEKDYLTTGFANYMLPAFIGKFFLDFTKKKL